MTSTRKKRPVSPGCDELSSKNRKLDRDTQLSREEKSANRRLMNGHVSCEERRVEEQKCNIVKSVHKDKNSKVRVQNSNPKKLNNHINVKNCLMRCNLGNVKLKELRVLVQDIKYIGVNETDLSMQKNNLWEVEKILAKKVREGTAFYLIKWKGWSSKYNTWEPALNLANSKEALVKFEKGRSRLINYFQRKVNFYPDSQDVRDYLKRRKRNGYNLCSLTDREPTSPYIKIQTYLKNKNDGDQEHRLTFIKLDIIRMLAYNMRKKQLKSLSDWESKMNAITEGKPFIQVENNVDLEEAPLNFYYIQDYLPGNGIMIPNDPPIGCECKPCNPKAKCCFNQDDGLCPYTSTYKIRVAPGTPIYECNKRCSCDMNCINRVVQRGSETKLCIFRTSNGRGWGVKTLEAIKKGTFVIQYVGEVISSEEAEKRGKEYDAAGRTYLFDLDYNETEGQCPYTVDGAVYGNISHFINHSCQPNLAVYAVWINCLDPNLPNLALFATRNIKPNEEITFDYMCQSLKNNSSTVKQNTLISEELDVPMTIGLQEEFIARPDTPESNVSVGKTLCKCGAKMCRRYLF